MNARYMLGSMLIFLFSISLVNAQKKYQGKLVSKLGQEQSGEITVNLDGSNNELIEITYSEQTKTKGKTKSQQTTSVSMKLNVALIKHITINDTIYYFRDIKYDYDDKYYLNVCVRLLEGTLNCGLFQQGRSTGTSNLSVKLPNSELSKLAAVDFDYYKATLGWHIFAFGKCKNLRSKMEEKLPGYYWNDDVTQEHRLVMWKSWIQEYNSCNIQSN
ncbi:MAG: hypothetical protein IPH18_03620 [Chitinophagaceae bacterium]|nr:hypothetical protein [Chitinophagaceae bacterium]MBK8953304.1 hypothetical protein [Chitinophagaceae bacterium]